MSEKLNTNPENKQPNHEQSPWDTLEQEVPFAGESAYEKRIAKRKEYLDLILKLSDGINIPSEPTHENTIKDAFNRIDDASKYEKHADTMQITAEIVDTAMLRDEYENREFQYRTSTSLNHKEKISGAEHYRQKSLEAQQLGLEKLRRIFPGLDDRKASEKFFGYESWAINPIELTSSVSTIPETDERTFDAQRQEVTSEQRPANPERAKMIKRAIELRQDLHSPAWTSEPIGEIGQFVDF